MTSTDLATTTPATPAPAPLGAGMPTPAEFAHVQAVANVLADSDLVPAAYRRRPANIVLAALAGRPFGWDPTMSMRSFHVIEGQPSMKPESMLALARGAGHSITGTIEGDGLDLHATVTGTRRDTGDTMTFTFSVADAITAGLCSWTDGKIRARNSKGKPLSWEKHPKSMVWARALSQLCRMLFPDVVLGAGYTPEELGARIADDDVIDVTEVDGIHIAPTTLTVAQAKRRILDACDDDVTAALAYWDSRPDHLHGERIDAGQLAAWIATLGTDGLPADDDVVDAEVIEEAS